MTLLVTGGTGFIGSHFLQAALGRGHKVFALRRPGSKSVRPLLHEPIWIDRELALLDAATISEHIPRGEEAAIFHFAAQGVNPKHATWESCFQTNVIDSINFWRAGVDAGISRLIVCGSCFEYGSSGENLDFISVDAPLKPTGPYHASKAAASLAAMALSVEKKLKTAILRPFHVFGEGEAPDRLWPALRRAAKTGEDFAMTSGEQIRDFVPVEAVADAFLSILAIPMTAGQPFLANVGTGQPQSLREFAEFWWRKWNASGELQFDRIPYRADEVMRYAPSPESLIR